MNRVLYIALVSLLPILSFGQKGSLTFRGGADFHVFDMTSLNDFMSKDRPGFYITPTGQITSGYSISSELSARITPTLSFGFFGSFLNARSKQLGSFLIPDPVLPNIYDTLYLEYEYRTPAFVIGIAPRYALHTLWSKASVEEQHLTLDAVARLGLGYAFLERSSRLTNADGSPNNFSDPYQYESRDFLLGIDLEAEYHILKSPIITGVGLRIGYQYYRTQNMRNRTGENVFGTNEQVRLNYSGFHAGAYILLGR